MIERDELIVKKNKAAKERKAHKESRVVAGVLLIACVVFGLAYFQTQRLRQGLIDVCAVQQDAYVQLVLDQIYLKENRDDREIIEEILGTLDSSSNKYWTFSDDQTMLFVKDVLETNKYKGFTASTYFVSDTAKEFFESLHMNKVTHSLVMIDDTQYVASGVVFEYDGAAYKLCLLTNKMVLLDNNELLRSSTEMTVLIAAVTMLFVLTALCYNRKVWQIQKQLDEKCSDIKKLNLHIEKLNDQISKRDIHDTRKNIWKKESLLGFAEKLQERETYPLLLALLQTDDSGKMKELIEVAHKVLDSSVLRFQMAGDKLLLLFVQCEVEHADKLLETVMSKDAILVEKTVFEKDSEIDLLAYCKRLNGGPNGDSVIS